MFHGHETRETLLAAAVVWLSIGLVLAGLGTTWSWWLFAPAGVIVIMAAARSRVRCEDCGLRLRVSLDAEPPYLCGRCANLRRIADATDEMAVRG